MCISEPIIESVPQVHILLCLWGLNPKLITGQLNFEIYDIDPLFLATFATLLISASKGIASFLLDGPCKLVPNNGLLGGLGTMGFIFLYLSINLTLIGKGTMLANSLMDAESSDKWVSIEFKLVLNITFDYNSEHIISRHNNWKIVS